MRRLQERIENVNLGGYFLWLHPDGQMLLVELEGIAFLALFSTAAKAVAMRQELRLSEPLKLLTLPEDASAFVVACAAWCG